MKHTVKTFFYNDIPAKITVSFDMDVIVWDLLQSSEQWGALEKLLGELETQVSQLVRPQQG